LASFAFVLVTIWRFYIWPKNLFGQILIAEICEKN
jgi:hypothetical protein